MKQGLCLVMLFLSSTGCTDWYQAATDVDVYGRDIVYLKDDRTNLCFALLFLENKVGTDVEEMGMTQVPCENLDGLEVR